MTGQVEFSCLVPQVGCESKSGTTAGMGMCTNASEVFTAGSAAACSANHATVSASTQPLRAGGAGARRVAAGRLCGHTQGCAQNEGASFSR